MATNHYDLYMRVVGAKLRLRKSEVWFVAMTRRWWAWHYAHGDK